MDKESLLHITRPQKHCMNCNAELETLNAHPSVLRQDGEQLQRWDYCPTCWEVIKREIYDCFWLARREPRTSVIPKLNRRQRNAALRALFETLWERREEDDVAPHLFLLAHLLMKWGGLKYRNETTDVAGARRLVFEDPATGETLEVESMDLDDARVLEVRETIERFMHEYAPEQDVAL